MNTSPENLSISGILPRFLLPSPRTLMDATSLLQTISIYAIPTIFAITAHEAAHGYAAKLLGDRTAERQGRLTLNPVPHIDPIGTIAVPAVLLMLGGPLFGWAKPVPIDPSKMRYPRKSPMWVALAGPASNFVMALLWALVALGARHMSAQAEAVNFLGAVGLAGIKINMMLMIFNLFPLPPLDGGHVVDRFLTGKPKEVWAKITPYGFFILIALSFTTLLHTMWFAPLMKFFSWIPAIAH